MVGLMIVAVACGAMLLATGQSLQASKASITTCRANLLAQELMNEISAMRWADRDQPQHWGPEAGEADTKTRAAFDDLDDYDSWTGPPQTRNGQKYAELQNQLFPWVTSHEYDAYTCSVRVRYVSADGKVLPSDQTSPFREVTVEVAQAGQPAERLTRVFQDHSDLLGSTHWFNPTTVEPVAGVQIVP
ncbi:MAG: hypothetical protein HY000_12915 [Planctomycetes bacterium]|nr:hypothetical protein [Planctomycetota bacterium]